MFRQSGLGCPAYEMAKLNLLLSALSSLGVPFCHRAERTGPWGVTHLYDRLVSQIASPVILRALMRKQKPGMEGKVKRHYNPVLAPLLQPARLPGALGQSKQAPAW